jgi:hypothetical protein
MKPQTTIKYETSFVVFGCFRQKTDVRLNVTHRVVQSG